MRYLGGGVGHCSPSSIPIYDECNNGEAMDPDEAPLTEHGDKHGATGNIPLEDNEDEVWESDEDSEEDENGSDTDRPYKSDGEDEDLGPEDGEDDDDDEADLDEYDEL